MAKQQAKDPLERAELLLAQLREAIREAGGVLKDMHAAKREMTEYASHHAPDLVERTMSERVNENLREIREFVDEELRRMGLQIPKAVEQIRNELLSQTAETIIAQVARDAVHRGIPVPEALEHRLNRAPVFPKNVTEADS